jgi:nitroreductase
MEIEYWRALVHADRDRGHEVREIESGMIHATPLGSGVQPASLAAQFQGRKSSTRFTG